MLGLRGGSNLLDFAAGDDADGILRAVAAGAAADHPSAWYTPSTGSESLTPLMVASLHGAAAAAAALIASGSDPNRRSDGSLSTPLHFAASSGSVAAADVVRLLLEAGADAGAADSLNRLPADVIALPPRRRDLRFTLDELLGGELLSSPVSFSSSSLSLSSSVSSSPPSAVAEKKEWPVDPSLPDIKNGVYASDEFRMYSFKVKQCSRAYSHDWTECPYVHPGENARRRDPRKYHYSCVPCPEFRKGICRRGDLCEYAHGVFECWLHPAQYRTRLCKDGTTCARRVCFFAHTSEELRPLYMSTGSAVPSPRGSAAGSSPPLDLGTSGFATPLSPSGNGGGGVWSLQQSVTVPAFQLPPGNNLQLSRLRTSLNARDVALDDLSALAMADLDGRLSSPVAGVKPAWGKLLMTSNLEELFSADLGSSPRYSGSAGDQRMMFSPTHENATLNQFQQHQSHVSSANTSGSCGFPPMASLPEHLSPQNSPAEPLLPLSSHLLHALTQHDKQQQQQQTLRCPSSRDLGIGASVVGCSQGEASWDKWGSYSGVPDWGVDNEELVRLRRFSSFELHSGVDGEDPDLSWVNSLVVDSTPEKLSGMEMPSNSNGYAGHGSAVRASHHGSSSGTAGDNEGTVLRAWFDQLQLDQMATLPTSKSPSDEARQFARLVYPKVDATGRIACYGHSGVGLDGPDAFTRPLLPDGL